MVTSQEILENKHIKVISEHILEDDRLLPCPFCGKAPQIAICDDEGNYHDIDYIDDPWSGLSFGLVHSTNEEDPDKCCPIATFEGEAMGTVSYDTIDELIERWNKRI